MRLRDAAARLCTQSTDEFLLRATHVVRQVRGRKQIVFCYFPGNKPENRDRYVRSGGSVRPLFPFARGLCSSWRLQGLTFPGFPPSRRYETVKRFFDMEKRIPTQVRGASCRPLLLFVPRPSVTEHCRSTGKR